MSQARFAIFAFAVIALFFNSAANAATENAKNLAAQAASANAAEARAAVAELRTLGADGLDALFETYAAEIAAHRAGKTVENWARIAAALDYVAMQKDAFAAGLFWHTDLTQAKKIAAKENKPILSLRLLGNLNEEFSCANSRFFRALLYPNAEISKNLKENYVLHWQSVRPAPRVTIDYGDGRKIERTITGNSIHYVLSADGAPLDALPGLYSPQKFQKWLTDSTTAFQNWQKLGKADRNYYPRSYHRQQLSSLSQSWRADLERAKIAVSKDTGKPPTAIQAAPLATAKMMTEATILREITNGIETLALSTNFDDWKKMAEFQNAEVVFDANTVRLIQAQIKEPAADSPRLARLLDNLKTAVALDTVRNERLMRPKLHEWFARGEAVNLDKFNEKVYAELFLTPDSDAWLGLYSPEIYVALDGDGIK